MSRTRQDSHPDHLGDAVAGLVDGSLDHPTRERALAHLAHCADCLTEVEGLRALRAGLLRLADRAPAPPGDLMARLLAVPLEPAQLPPSPSQPSHALPYAPGPPSVGQHPAGLRRPRVHTVTAAGAMLAIGLGGVLAVGGPQARPRPVVDPTSTVLLTDVVDLEPELPLLQQIGVRPAQLVGTSAP